MKIVKLKNLFLYEAKEYEDADIVDYDEINLQSEFNKLNSLLFNGKLNPVPMVWATTRRKHGSVRASYDRLTNVITIKKLTMSKFLRLSYKAFKDVLAHEMIHVYFLQNGDAKENHGSKFIREMNRINGMGLGFNIEITTSYDQYEVNTTSSEKEYIFALVTTSRYTDAITYASAPIFMKNMDAYVDYYKKLVNLGYYKTIKIDFYKTTSPNILKVPSIRKFDRIKAYSIPIELKNSLVKSAIKINTINIP